MKINQNIKCHTLLMKQNAYSSDTLADIIMLSFHIMLFGYRTNFNIEHTTTGISFQNINTPSWGITKKSRNPEYYPSTPKSYVLHCS
jgi:hypothetical protein